MIADQIRAAFAEMSQRKTRPRQLIAECLIERAAAGVDFSVDDLWHTLRQRDPQMGRATVYRAVEMLVQVDLLDRIEFGDGTHHYRVCGSAHHHHLTCTRCRQVIEIDLCLPEEQLLALAQQTGYAVDGHALTVFGRCTQCRAQTIAERNVS